MMKKLSLLAAAVLALGVTTAACSGDDDDGSSHSFTSGDYSLTINDIPTNTCFDPGLVSLLNGVSFTVGIVSTNGETFLLLTEPPLSTFLPPVTGTIDGDDLAATGSVPAYPVGTNGCAIDIAATADGELTGNDQFDAVLGITLTVPASLADECSDYPILGSFGGFDIPFPTLTNNSSGTCNLDLGTSAVIL